jgi:hypothetical protein
MNAQEKKKNVKGYYVDGFPSATADNWNSGTTSFGNKGIIDSQKNVDG